MEATLALEHNDEMNARRKENLAFAKENLHRELGLCKGIYQIDRDYVAFANEVSG